MFDVTVEGFHVRAGWYFRRGEGGRVRITRLEQGHEALQFELLPTEWASVVAAVSPGGETMEKYDQAAVFHGRGKDFL